jgi:hypothetical protein
MPANVPIEQSTPEYAAAILKLAEEGFASNPNIAASNPAGQLTPMGPPIPDPVTQVEQERLRQAQLDEGDAAAYAALRPNVPLRCQHSRRPPAFNLGARRGLLRVFLHQSRPPPLHLNLRRFPACPGISRTC